MRNSTNKSTRHQESNPEMMTLFSVAWFRGSGTGPQCYVDPRQTIVGLAEARVIGCDKIYLPDDGIGPLVCKGIFHKE